jgi:hypothetical protein
MNTSVKFLDDVLDGENVLESAKSRLKEGGRAFRATAKAQAKDGAMRLARTAKRKLREHGGGSKGQQGYGLAVPVRGKVSHSTASTRAGRGARGKKPRLSYRTIFNV